MELMNTCDRLWQGEDFGRYGTKAVWGEGPGSDFGKGGLKYGFRIFWGSDA